MILLDIKNKALEDLLILKFNTFLEGLKSEKSDVILSDFDGVIYHISNSDNDKTKIMVSISIKYYNELCKHGLNKYLKNEYGSLYSPKSENGYDVSLILNLKSLTDNLAIQISQFQSSSDANNIPPDTNSLIDMKNPLTTNPKNSECQKLLKLIHKVAMIKRACFGCLFVPYFLHLDYLNSSNDKTLSSKINSITPISFKSDENIHHHTTTERMANGNTLPQKSVTDATVKSPTINQSTNNINHVANEESPNNNTLNERTLSNRQSLSTENKPVYSSPLLNGGTTNVDNHSQEDILSAKLKREESNITQLDPSKTPEPLLINYRENEAMYVDIKEDRLTIVFSTLFLDEEDTIIGKIFLQEFKEGRKASQNAPHILFGTEPPREFLSRGIEKTSPNMGYITFVLFPRHTSPQNRENTVDLLFSFRNYFHYHIKCSKAYVHSRMRTKTSDFLKILNRAKPDKIIKGPKHFTNMISAKTQSQRSIPQSVTESCGDHIAGNRNKQKIMSNNKLTNSKLLGKPPVSINHY